VRGEAARELSPRWRAAPAPATRLARLVPPWVAAPIAAALLAAAWIAFSWSLGRQAVPVYAALDRLGQGRSVVSAVAPVPRTLSLREALAPEIAAGSVEVTEQSDGSLIEIHGDGLFASGSADIDPAAQPVLERIGAALDPFAGAIRVTGHTDNQPLAMSRALRWSNNWELSQARADAVAMVLTHRLAQPARVVAEGRGDAEPKAPNDSPAHRARNRRVDITLQGPATVQAATAHPVDTRRPS
jgi:type VI secretion system protein ImpK